MPELSKRRKRVESASESRTSNKRAKLANGKASSKYGHSKATQAYDIPKSDESEGIQSDFSDEEVDDRLKNLPEDGVDLSELLGNDDDDTPVTEPSSNRPTLEHVNMLKSLRSDLGLDYASQRAKKLQNAREAIPARPENSALVSTSSKIDLNDLIETVEPSKDIKKQLKKLDHSERRLQGQVSKETRAKSDRIVQYADTKKLLSEWQETVDTMKSMDTVVFPLKEQMIEAPRLSTTKMAADFAPQTDLEKAVFGIIEESGITEEKIRAAEDLMAQKMNAEELIARQKQLAKMRSLFFYQEQKNKRQAKIKSKKYRKILKKAKEREEKKNELTLDELAELDPQAYKERLEELDRIRAEERMGIKHRHMGKWAKYALRSKDPNLMAAAREHLEHGRNLLKKIRSDRDDDDEEDDSDEFDDDSSIHSEDLKSDHEQDENDNDSDLDVIDIHGNLVSSTKKKTKDDPDAPNDGVFSMKFMQRAAARKQSEHDQLMEAMDDEWNEQRKKLLEQRKKAKDDYVDDGTKYDSDSEEEEIIPKKKTSGLEDEQKKVESQKMKAVGRMKMGASEAEMIAANTELIMKSRSTQDDDSDSEDFAGTSLMIDRPTGYSASIKGNLSVKAKAAMKMEESDSEDSDGESMDVDEESDVAVAFVPNQHDVKSKLAEQSNKKAEELSQKPAKKSSAVKQATETTAKSKNTTTANQSSDNKSAKQSQHKNANVEQTAPASNPWMQVEDDEEDDQPNKSQKSSSTKKGKKKLNEDKIAVDLQKVQKKLLEDEKKHGDLAFNLTTASATSKSQRELIARAFAADHVTEQEILSEKQEAVENANEVEKEYATLVMPGWGEWAGNGLKPSARRQRLLQEMKEKKEKRSDELMSSRKDSKLKHVVISGKKQKQFAKYQASKVPSKFKGSAGLYEASLRQPMGSEWNVRSVHAALVRPKVEVRQGFAIEPIQVKKEGIRREQKAALP